MDPKEAYVLMSKRFYDEDNYITFVPKKLNNYFENLGNKNNKYHYDYKNLDDLFDLAFKVLVNTNIEEQEKFILKIKSDTNIVFNLTNTGSNFYSIGFQVKKKNDKGICVFFQWYPFLNFIYINNLFYDTGDKKKLNANRDCEVFNIPEKSGLFFLNLIEDISKRFGVKKIILQDASTIVFNDLKVNLALFYLQKHGKTYYGKFGFEPIKLKEPNSEILKDIAYNIKFENAKDDLEYVKSKLKKIKQLTENNVDEWIKNTSELKNYFPAFYIKKIK